MTLGIDNIKVHVVDRFPDGYFFLFLIYLISRHKHCRLRRTVEVDKMKPFRWCDRGQFFTASGEIVQRMVFDTGSKLIGHLCRHKAVCDMFALEVVVQCDKIESYFLRNDMHSGTTSQCRIGFHHVGIETIAGIGGYMMFGLQTVIALIPMAEGHKVAMCQLTTLGYARRA